jgi:hypothetical protein
MTEQNPIGSYKTGPERVNPNIFSKLLVFPFARKLIGAENG